jgi:hypothetical protein
MLLGTFRRRGGRAALWLVVGLIVGGLAGAAVTYVLKRGKAGIEGGPRLGDADEFAFVPPDAAGFVHVRARGIWNDPSMAEVRKMVEAAGPQAKAALDDGFVPAPSTLDRLTVVLVKPPTEAKGGKGPPAGGGNFDPFAGDFGAAADDVKPVLLLTFNAAFDAAKVREAHAKAAVAKKAADKEYWEDAEGDVALYFPTDTTLAVGDVAAVKAYLGKLSQGGTGPLTKAIESARAGGFHFAAAVNLARLGIPVGKLADAPGDFKEVAKELAAVVKAEAVMLGTGFGEGGAVKLEVRAAYKDDAAAAESEKALREIAAFAKKKLAEPKKQMEEALAAPPGAPKTRPLADLPRVLTGVFGLGALNTLDGWLTDPPLKTEGVEVVLAPKVPSMNALYAGSVAASVGMLLPAVDKVRGSATRMKDSNNLKQIGLAFHNYESIFGYLPSQDGSNPINKKGGLSWRVHLLPYLEQEPLYRQFNLDEPWDSPTNKKLIDQMPPVYISPLAADPVGQTRYKVFNSKDAVIYPGSRTTIIGITDGSSNTILAVGGGPPVIWTKPDDITVTPALAPSALALPGHPGCNVLMGDGSVRWVDLSTLTAEQLRAAMTRSGGEVFGLDAGPPVPARPAPVPAPKTKTK